jgi:uncharacterized membrane protein YbhN (UPF0104 family)/tRNA A-37 threonylcarbamoyl transferase component Bud32
VTHLVADVDTVATRLDAEPRHYERWAASDMIRLIFGLTVLGLGLFLAAVAQNTIGGAERDIIEWFNRLPHRSVGVVIGSAQLLVVVVPLAVYALLLWRRLFRLFGMLLLGSAIASVITTLVEASYADRLGIVEDTHSISRGWITDPAFPTSSYVASVAAFVTITAPWLGRRWRRATWLTLILLVILRIIGSGEPPLDIIVAVAMGLVIGSLTLLVFGSPTSMPRVAELLRALRQRGIVPTGIAQMEDDDSLLRFVVDTDQRRLFVKVRTPQDRSADLLNRFWASLRLRSSEVERPYSTLKRRVEHEALAATVAGQGDADVPIVVGLGETEHGSVFLATEFVSGRTLADLDTTEMSEPAIESLWAQIAELRLVGLAHRNLSLQNLILDADNCVWLLDFDRAELAAADRDMDRDVAELLVGLAAKVDVDTAVSSAVRVLGPDTVAGCLTQLQPLALPPDLRKVLKGRKGLLDDIAEAVEEATGAAPVSLEKLERIKPKTVLMIVVGAFAFYSLLPQLADIDETFDAFGDANLWWIPAILAGSAATYVFATVSALGAYSLDLPILATWRSQLASSFTALVAPANAGGMALGVRFLQRAGFDSASASTAVGLNAIGGIVAHIVLLFAFVSWTGQTGVGDIKLPDTTTTLVVLAVILVLSVLLLLIRPIRQRFVTPVLKILKSAGGHLGAVFRSPLRVLALFGGSALVTLAYAATLVFSVEAFGGGITIPEICTAFIVAVTIATVAPTPGGLGALEAAMIASLSGFGMDHGPAVSATLTFRLATFWLPILPGWATFVWMERNEEL